MTPYVRINAVAVGSNPFDSRPIIDYLPCKFSLRLWNVRPNDGRHLGDFDTYFEAKVFAVAYAQEHNAEISDNTQPRQRQQP